MATNLVLITPRECCDLHHTLNSHSQSREEQSTISEELSSTLYTVLTVYNVQYTRYNVHHSQSLRSNEPSLSQITYLHQSLALVYVFDPLKTVQSYITFLVTLRATICPPENKVITLSDVRTVIKTQSLLR